MILDKYVKAHEIGAHCTTTCLTTILKGNGYTLSEDFVLGLSSALGFTYQKYLNSDFYFFTGRNESIEINLAGILGGRVFSGHTENSEAGWSAVKEYINYGIPVILDLDMMHLPYLARKLNLKNEFHFGLHNALLVGFNEKSNTAYLLDYMWNDLIEIDLEDLSKARNSMSSPVNPMNGWKAIVIDSYDTNYLYEVKEAIKINIHRMKYPFAFKMALPGLKMFTKEIQNWTNTQTEVELKNNAYMAATLFEKVGTGGGNFRRMYGRFLTEASKIEGLNELSKAATNYFELSRMWKEIAKLFFMSSEDISEGIYSKEERVINLINSLVDKEYAAIDLLLKIVSG